MMGLYQANWRIGRDGEQEHSGSTGVFLTLREAQIAALHSINENWTHDNWSDYEESDIHQFKKYLVQKDYEKALTLWRSISTYYVEVVRLDVQEGPLLIDWKEMGLEIPEREPERP